MAPTLFLGQLSEIECAATADTKSSRNDTAKADIKSTGKLYAATILEWQRTMLNANIAFDEGFLIYANCLYERAVEKAVHLFESDCCKQTVAILLCSFHNLADFYMRNNNKADALNCLYQSVACLSYAQASQSDLTSKKATLIWGLAKANQQVWLIEKQGQLSTISKL